MKNVKDMSYQDMIDQAEHDESFRQGLLAAVEVCRAQNDTCPAIMAAVYIENVANGDMP